jgi:hypothetical protein
MSCHSDCGAYDLGVLYAQDSGRQRESHQRRREEHFEARDIALTGLRLLVEGVGGVYAVAVGGTCL